jgi:UV DNA damage endonuclease
LLPVCEELNIPFCLDFHHHNIIFSPSLIREGTHDIRSLFPRIKATWDRKRITQKMHYSEPCPEAVTGRQRRKHNPRPATLPPCPDDMDLMIEAKDKEQAVFELMRTFRLPGWDSFNNIIPYEREDDNKPLPKKAKKKKTKKQIAADIEEFGKELSEEEEVIKEEVPEDEVGMGGKENRVYWPVGMEEWLRPKKREVKKKSGEDEEDIFKNPTPANFEARRKATARNKEPLDREVKERLREAGCVADVQRILDGIKEARIAAKGDDEEEKTPKRMKKEGSAKKTQAAKKKDVKRPPPTHSS